MEEKVLRAGVIGLGMIGGGVAESLRNTKHTATAVYDAFPEQYKKHKGCKNQVASPAEVAENADVIMIAVFDAKQAKDVLAGENGLLSKAHEDMAVVLLSTVSVDDCKEMESMCEEKGVGFLDAGVTPGMLADDNGLVALCGGKQETYDFCKPVLDWWGAGSVLLGPVGSGMTAKIARNMITYGTWAIVSDAVKLVNKYGMDVYKFQDALQLCDKQEPTTYKIAQIRAFGGREDMSLDKGMSDMLLGYFTKDLGASIALSEQLGIELPVRDFVYNNKEKILDAE